MMPLESFLKSDNLPPSKNTILNDPPIIHKLADTGEPFVKATYHMERDGPLVSSAYEEISLVPFALLFQIHSTQM